MTSLYDIRPWLKLYPDWVPHDLEITRDTALDDFRTSAARRPNTPAVYYFDHEISYGEIDRLSDSLATAFYNLGLKRGDRILLDLQNVPQFLIALYAAWRLGAIVVPLNPMYKEKELTYFCQDSGARIFFTLEEVARDLDLSFLKETSIEKVVTTSPLDLLPPNVGPPKMLKGAKKISIPGTLDMLGLLDRYEGKEVKEPEVSPDDVAYLTYTSGTTGPLPKGQ